MEQTVSPTELRIIIAVIGVLVLAAIYLFGRASRSGTTKRRLFSRERRRRIEPVLRESNEDGAADDTYGNGDSGFAVPRPQVGTRSQDAIERIVTLFVKAPAGEEFSGADIVVAAEKTGLVFGDMGIFHRLVAGSPEQGPLFSMASMIKPGSFDMAALDGLRTPGLSLFMTLPGPLPALDAWDTLLPAAQRMAELLGGTLQDDQHNTLGRQRIAHLRDDLRAWDRKQEGMRIRSNW